MFLLAVKTIGWLVALDGAHAGEDFRLAAGRNTLGSSVHADIALTAPNISGLHAEILGDDAGVTLIGRMSRGELAVNGEPVEKIRLEDGDELKLGLMRLQYRSSARQKVGYRPQFRPRPQAGAAIRLIKNRFICGWIVGISGEYGGLDFRLLNGKNTVGSARDLEITLLGASVRGAHALIDCSDNVCRVTASEQALVMVDNEIVTTVHEISDSQVLKLGSHEFYLKWF